MFKMKCAIWWIRRDLRLTDNGALHAAAQHAEQVIPLFILDPQLQNSDFTGRKRLDFLMAGLHSLNHDLQELGSRLIIRWGDPLDVFFLLLHEIKIDAIYSERDYSPYAAKRDQALLENPAIPLHIVSSHTIRPPEQVLKKDDTPYTVYTPYRRVWQSRPTLSEHNLLLAPTRLNTPADIYTQPLPENSSLEHVNFQAGEDAAKSILSSFVSNTQFTAPIYDYTNQRNRPDIDGTAQISPHLRFGMISARQAATAAYQAITDAPDATAQENAETWLSELIWRDFYITILHHFPHVRGHNFRRKYDAIVWNQNLSEFNAWCYGQTGYPYIDAAMRQLIQSGWMHNRARMAVASFLVKDLLIDWRWGEKWFMQHLIDGDPAANNGGWQWAAGTGTDAAPYFRIFNPVSQGTKHDPEGNYVRRWVPELALVPKKYIHEPWKIPLSEQKKYNCLIGQTYPPPMVDHKWARQRTLEAYAQC